MSVKIEYKIAGGAGGYTVLADTSDTVKDFRPQTEVGAMQRDTLDADAGSQGAEFRAARGNISVKLDLEITKTYGTEDLASAGARANTVAFISKKLTLKVTKGSDVEYYPKATCSKFGLEYKGATIEMAIALETDLVTASEPA